MLKLKKVDMVGFKSFADRTSLHFNGGGIAAVVGPNGCGKSNVSDAINWVLGEQSAKSLRGERMMDVIFNGTRDRKPTGMAEVTLTLVDPAYYKEGPQPVEPESSNGDGEHKAKPKEVVIGRRLFRSGESEYLLNGQSCRLRDIQEIFLGTGLGPNSYAIIEQGRIGQILSSKPYDRRTLIEEAAGVTRFKAKRRLAEARLEASKQNLARVNDILEEINRQVGSLKRQASKARRFGEMKEELRSQIRVVFLSKQAEMTAQAAQAAADLAAATETLQGQVTQVEAMEQEQFDLSHGGFQKEDLLRQRREVITGLALEIDRAHNRIAYQEKQIQEIQARLQESAAQVEQARARVAALEAEHAGSQQAVLAAQTQWQGAQEHAGRLQEESTASEAAYNAAQGKLESLRNFLILMLGEVSELKNQLAQVEEYLAGLSRQQERADRERMTAVEEESQLRARRGDLTAQMSQQQMELESVASRKTALEEGLARFAAETVSTQQRLEEFRRKHADARARRDSLEQILAHRAYTGEAVKRLFTGDGDRGAFRPLGLLADYLEVDVPYEHQVEDFLREELDYVVVESWEAAGDGLRLLRGDVEGRATFLIHPPQEASGPKADVRPLPPMDSSKVMGRLLDHIRLNNGLAASTAALLPRLKNCYLVESTDTGRLLAAAHPEFFFLAPSGECFHGYTVTGGKRTNAGPLALKRELRELAPEAEKMAAEMEECTRALKRLEEDTAQARQELQGLQDRQVEQERLAAGADQELKQLTQQLQRTAERLSVAALEIERIERERSRATGQAERLRSDIAARAARRVEVETEMGGLSTQVTDLAQRRSGIALALSEARAQMAALEERSRAAAATLHRLEQTLEAERASAAELENQTIYGAGEIERLQADNVAAAQRAEAAAVERTAAELSAATLQDEMEAGRTRMVSLEEEIKAARAGLEQFREQKSALEVQQARLESDRNHLEETCRTELGQALAELAEASGEFIALSGEGLIAAEEQARLLRERIEALGPVNMMALEEYQEASQRLEFLLTQHTDLMDSIRDTQQAIQEIDTVSRQQFQEAFEAINTNFTETFRTLFGGGYGSMRLSEAESDADAGIDLVVQPPGKRLQNVLLLSGGEKALTALALLLAVFRYQPSPFCILDEVDAPLDESNIGRFTEMVGTMSLETQFIVITHSRKTMEAAPVLYGVTMDEPGVSRVVSVRLNEPILARSA